MSVELDFSECEKIYMIREKRSGKHCGFRLATESKTYPYKNYGSALGYIKRHGSINAYEIDVFVCIHRDLKEVDKEMYKC